MALVMVCVAALAAWYQLRGNVGGISPYETVNNLYEQERLSITLDKAVYPPDVGEIALTLRNDASDYILIQDEPHTDNWVLERKPANKKSSSKQGLTEEK